MRKTTIAAFVGGLALAGAATAHTPYLKPTNFAPDRAFVTVEAALAETAFFIPDFPIRQQGDYWATGENGQAVKVTAVTMLKELAAVEVDLPADGTYRISTGERAGRSSKWAKIDGAWKMVRPANAPPPRGGGEGRSVAESEVPAGAETMTSTSYMRADTYVSRGAPTKGGALKPTGQGLEVEPITHPNEAFAGEAFKFRMLFDGKPLAHDFAVARGGDAYVEKRFSHSGKTDAKGEASVTFKDPGAYVLEIHYPTRAEGNPNPMPRNAIYTLTFEVTR